MQVLNPFHYFHRVLQAPASAEDMGAFSVSQSLDNAATTTDAEALGDRGDDFDEALFEETDDAPRRPAADKTKEEKPTDEAKPADKPADEAKPEDKPEDKPVDKKPSRAEKRIQQLAERNAALERQLAERTGSVQVAQELTTLETKAADLDKQYHKALAEDPEKASELMRQIRKIDRDIARIEAAAEAEIAVQERLETRDLQTTIATIVEKYPMLQKGNEEFDQELTTEINAVFQGLIPISSSKAAAMQRAVKMVMGDHESQPAGLGEATKADEVRESRRSEATKKTVDTINRQPASVSTVGTQGAKPITGIKTIKDLDDVSEEELAKLRGDDG